MLSPLELRLTLHQEITTIDLDLNEMVWKSQVQSIKKYTSKLGLSEISIYLHLLYAWSIPYIKAKNNPHTTKATLIYYYLLHTQQSLAAVPV